MRKCPFCGMEVKFVFPYLIYLEEPEKWSFFHHCNDHRGLVLSATTKERVIELWNERESDV